MSNLLETGWEFLYSSVVPPMTVCCLDKWKVVKLCVAGSNPAPVTPYGVTEIAQLVRVTVHGLGSILHEAHHFIKKVFQKNRVNDFSHAVWRENFGIVCRKVDTAKIKGLLFINKTSECKPFTSRRMAGREGWNRREGNFMKTISGNSCSSLAPQNWKKDFVLFY